MNTTTTGYTEIPSVTVDVAGAASDPARATLPAPTLLKSSLHTVPAGG